MRFILSAAVIALGLSAGPANAAILEFYEGNNCTQSMLRGVDSDQRQYADDVGRTNMHNINDEIRSVKITSNWRRRQEPRVGLVKVYDSPDGKTWDDWVGIVIRDATQIPEQGVCIPSFERNFDRAGVYLDRHPENGIDGKISRIETVCDASCRTNLTSVPLRVIKMPMKIRKK